jgi:peptidoglycan-associated lipoprotein
MLKSNFFRFSIFFLLSLSYMIFSEDRNSHRPFMEPLNTQNVEYNPVISPKGNYLVFQSNRPGGKGGMDIWISENKNFPNRIKFPEWKPPENFQELNSESFEGLFSILFNQENDKPEEVYFTSLKSATRDGYKGLNIYFTDRIEGSKNWKNPIHLNEINSNFNDRMPAISPDGKILIFSSDRPGGVGGFDLWISFRYDRNEKWSEPINLGNRINTSFNEIAPSFHWDGETLYFSSDRSDSEKKFRILRSNWMESDLCRTEGFEKLLLPYRQECWENPAELGFPFNTQFFEPETSVGAFDRYDPKIPLSDYRFSDNEGISISSDDLWVYFASNRPGGLGQFDIYRSPMPDDMRKSYEFIFNGLVLDGSEKLMIGIDSTLKIYEETKPFKVITSSRIGGELKPINKADKVKNFETVLKTGRMYRVEVSSPGFYPTELIVDLRGNIGRGKSRYETIVLEKIKPVQPKVEGIEFAVYDKKTEELIPNSKIKLFTSTIKEGSKLSSENGIYTLINYPEEDFELQAQAEGYKTDTFFYELKEIPDLVGKSNKLFLTNLKDIDKVFATIIYFPTNIAELSTDDKNKLNLLASYMISHPKEILEIGGHTDNVATKEYNIKLSQTRAESVKRYLLAKGIPESRMKIKAYYYSQPAEDNSTEQGRAKNRRVNFKKVE